MHSDNGRIAAEAQVLSGLIDEAMLRSDVSGCVSPFVAQLEATFSEAQLSAEKLKYEKPVGNSFDVLGELARQLPGVFGVDALKKYIEDCEETEAAAQRAFARAIEHVEREQRQND